jgi:hypothetical protein
LAAVGLAGTLLAALPTPAAAQSRGIGYDGARIQMKPLMVPVREKKGGVSYHPLVVRLMLSPGRYERPACFSVPYVHERVMMHLARTPLERADLVGPRREILARTILEIATQATAHGYYLAAEVVDDSSPPLEPRSQVMSTMCR